MAKEETKKCKKCMEEINKKAKRCPKCGANLGVPGFVKVLIVLGLILFLCVSCMSSCTEAVDESIKETENSYLDINGKKEFNVGESFENKYLKVTLTDVNLDWKDYDEYSKPSAGKKIVRVAIEAKNIGEESEDISSLYFECYADDVVVDEYLWADDGTEFGGAINPGKVTKGALYYEIPVDTQNIVLDYEPSVLDDDIVVHFNLK